MLLKNLTLETKIFSQSQTRNVTVDRLPTSDEVILSRKLEEKTRSLVIKVLRGWVNQRNKALKTSGFFDGKKSGAVDKILLMLERHEYSRLHVLCRRIVQDGEFFIRLVPNKKSRQFPFFKNRVAVVLLWADRYRKDFDNSSNIGIRTI